MRAFNSPLTISVSFAIENRGRSVPKEFTCIDTKLEILEKATSHQLSRDSRLNKKKAIQHRNKYDMCVINWKLVGNQF